MEVRAMELKSIIESRRSIRKFLPDPIPDEYVNEILDAARQAPSGGNIQPWRFVIIKSPEAREKLKDFTLGFVASAPVIIVCCSDLNANRSYRERYKELRQAGAFEGVVFDAPQSSSEKVPSMNEDQIKGYLNLNTAIAVEHMILRATDLGLGSCWVMMFNRQQLASWLQLDNNLYPVCLLPIGFADQKPHSRPRKNLEEIIVKEV
jgi:nitroreductase